MIVSVALEDIMPLYRSLPEFDSRHSLTDLQAKAGRNYLALVWRQEGVDLGFKLGYAVDEREFYSWLGGVLPEGRGRGIAQALLERQEQWAIEHGFELISVKTMRRFPAMLRLLSRNQYDSVGVEGAGDSARLRYEKRLQSTSSE